MDFKLYLATLALYLLFFIWIAARISNRIYSVKSESYESQWAVIFQGIAAMGGAGYLFMILQESKEWTLILNLRNGETASFQVVLSYLLVMTGVAFVLLALSAGMGIWIAKFRFRSEEARSKEPPPQRMYFLLAACLAAGLAIMSYPGYLMIRKLIIPSLQDYLIF